MGTFRAFFLHSLLDVLIWAQGEHGKHTPSILPLLK